LLNRTTKAPVEGGHTTHSGRCSPKNFLSSLGFKKYGAKGLSSQRKGKKYFRGRGDEAIGTKETSYLEYPRGGPRARAGERGKGSNGNCWKGIAGRKTVKKKESVNRRAWEKNGGKPFEGL